MHTCPGEIVTNAFRLRRLRKTDTDAFIAMNADLNVMEFFPRLWSPEESKAALARIEQAFDERGFGIYAIEVSGTFGGIVGLSIPTFNAPFTPCVEILWRLTPASWGKGHATAAAAAVLQTAFQTLSLEEVVSFASRNNVKSIRVMQKIGMRLDPHGDFDHPDVEDPTLRPHVLYRISADHVRQR